MSALFDRVKQLVLQIIAPLDFYALYPVEVVAQNEDDTVEIKSQHKRVSSTSRVPIRGLPGVRVRVKQGTRMLLGWEAGDERAPFVSLATADGLEELIVTASVKVVVNAPQVFLGDEDGAQPVSRVGDLVEVALPPEAIFSGVMGVPPAVTPLTGVITFTDTAAGYITAGSSKVNSA